MCCFTLWFLVCLHCCQFYFLALLVCMFHPAKYLSRVVLHTCLQIAISLLSIYTWICSSYLPEYVVSFKLSSIPKGFHAFLVLVVIFWTSGTFCGVWTFVKLKTVLHSSNGAKMLHALLPSFQTCMHLKMKPQSCLQPVGVEFIYTHILSLPLSTQTQHIFIPNILYFSGYKTSVQIYQTQTKALG